MPKKVEVSHKTIVFSVFFLLSLWFIYLIRDIILIFFVSLLIMTILNPLVTKLSRFKIPRAFSVLIVYFLILGLLGTAIGGIIPPLIEQTKGFVEGLPIYLSNLGIPGNYSEQIIKELLSEVATLPGQILRLSISLFSNALEIVTVLFFAFYLLLARDKIDEHLGLFFGEERKKEIMRILSLLETRLGGWARGELGLMTLVGVFTYIGVKLLGIPFALPISILAGVLEIVPYIGPIIAAVPLVIIGFGISPVMGLSATALAFLVQQLENYIFVPKVMEKSVGVNPVITLLSLTIGFKMAGVVGVLISVPVVITLQILLNEYLTKNKLHS